MPIPTQTGGTWGADCGPQDRTHVICAKQRPGQACPDRAGTGRSLSQCHNGGGYLCPPTSHQCLPLAKLTGSRYLGAGVRREGARLEIQDGLSNAFKALLCPSNRHPNLTGGKSKMLGPRDVRALPKCEVSGDKALGHRVLHTKAPFPVAPIIMEGASFYPHTTVFHSVNFTYPGVSLLK